jgi:HK97 family phage portal protein
MANFLTKQRSWPWQKKSVSSGNISEIWGELLRQSASNSGIDINWKTVLQYSTAQACIRIIAEDIAQLPFATYRTLPDGGSEQMPDHPTCKLLKTKPNSEQTAFEMREQIGLHLVLTNNAYVLKVISNGKIVELLPFEPHLVEVKRKNKQTTYVITMEDGRRETVPSREMWHLRGPSWNGYQGLDGVRLMRDTIGLGLALEAHGAKVFKNGATVGGILSTDQSLTDDQRKKLKESWEDKQSGIDNAYKTAVMWAGMKWSPSATPNDSAQFLETRRFQVEETCRHFKVLPIMVGHADKTTTYASAEQMVLIHLRQTLGPWLSRIEQSANCNLFTDQELEAGYFTKFTRNALLAMTAQVRAEFYTKMYGVGAINPNEIRALEDMNPYIGGDTYRVPLNMEDPANPETESGNTDNDQPSL